MIWRKKYQLKPLTWYIYSIFSTRKIHSYCFVLSVVFNHVHQVIHYAVFIFGTTNERKAAVGFPHRGQVERFGRIRVGIAVVVVEVSRGR